MKQRFSVFPVGKYSGKFPSIDVSDIIAVLYVYCLINFLKNEKRNGKFECNRIRCC